MATLQSYIDKLPPLLKARYSTGGYFITWANQLLEKLQSEGYLPEVKKEAGKIVLNDEWLEKPSDLVSLIKVMDPSDRNRQIRVEEVEGKYRLLDYTLQDQEAADQLLVTTFSDYAVGSMKVDLTGYGKDSFENYLFLVTAGTYAGRAYILSGNDASTTDTKIYFLHDLPSALDGTKITDGRLVPPYYYYLLQYRATYEKLTAASDELPISDNYESRIVPVWLEWKAQRQASMISQETMVLAAEVQSVLDDIEATVNSRPVNRAKGRRLIGLERDVSGGRSDDRTFTDIYGA